MDILKELDKKENNIREIITGLLKSKEEAISEAEIFKNNLIQFSKTKYGEDVKIINDIFNNKVEKLNSQIDDIKKTKDRVQEKSNNQDELENIRQEISKKNPPKGYNLRYLSNSESVGHYLKKGSVVENDEEVVAITETFPDAGNKDLLLVTRDIGGSENREGEIRAVLSVEGVQRDSTTDSEKYEAAFTIFKGDTKLKLLRISLLGESVKFLPFLPMKSARVIEKKYFENYCNDPLGITVSEKDEIFVGDNTNSKIHVFDMEGNPKRSFSLKYDNEKYAKPRGLEINRGGNLVIADFGGQVCFFDTQGGFLNRFGEGNLHSPAGVAVSSDGHIHVADQGGGCVKTFTPDGKLLRTIGKYGAEEKKFIDPTCVAVNSKDQIIVSDGGNHRVQVFDRNGNFLFTCGKRGEFYMYNPLGVIADRFDNILVCDCYNDRIQMFSPEGVYIGRADNPNDRIKKPHSITTAPGQIYKIIVTEDEANCVRILVKK